MEKYVFFEICLNFVLSAETYRKKKKKTVDIRNIAFRQFSNI